MPQRRNAIKKIRQDIKRRQSNLGIKTDLKKHIKSFQKLIAGKKIEDAKAMLQKLLSKVDKAAKKGILHKNTASRKKSQFMLAVNKTA